jgi:hypothetical protein
LGEAVFVVAGALGGGASEWGFDGGLISQVVEAKNGSRSEPYQCDESSLNALRCRRGLG